MIDDREWYMLTGQPRIIRLFFDRILPLLAFAGIILLLFILCNQFVNLTNVLIEPLSKGFKAL